MDLWLLTLTIVYCVLGCIMIYSASSVLTVLSLDVPSTYYFFRQVIIVAVSLFISLFILKIPTSKYRYLSFIAVFLIMVALVGLYLYVKFVNGAQGWYDLGFFNLQPAEFAKTIMIINMACYYNSLIRNKERN